MTNEVIEPVESKRALNKPGFTPPRQSVPSANPLALWRRRDLGRPRPPGSCFTSNRLIRAWALRGFYARQVATMLRGGSPWSDFLRYLVPLHVPVREVPPSLHVEFTNQCNLACTYCNTHDEPRVKGMMSAEVFERLVEEVRSSGVRRINLVGNGEPTIHPNFPDYVVRLTRATGTLSLTSNFQRASDAVIGALVDAPVAFLNVSVDGADRDKYERHRRRGSFETLLKNLARLRAARDSAGSPLVVNVRLMLHPSDEGTVAQKRAFWSKHADIVTFQHVVDTRGDGGGDVYDLRTSPDQYPTCSIPFKMLQVRWDGSVPLCTYYYLQADQPADFVLGNILTGGLRELWAHPLIRHYRRAQRDRAEGDMPLCAGCGGC